MAIKKSRNQVGLIAIDLAGLAAANKVTRPGLSDFRISLWRERLAQHCGCNRHIQKMEPAIHPGKSFGQVALRLAERYLVEPGRNGDIAAERIPHQLLVKTLDCRQDR